MKEETKVEKKEINNKWHKRNMEEIKEIRK